MNVPSRQLKRRSRCVHSTSMTNVFLGGPRVTFLKVNSNIDGSLFSRLNMGLQKKRSIRSEISSGSLEHQLRTVICWSFLPRLLQMVHRPVTKINDKASYAFVWHFDTWSVSSCQTYNIIWPFHYFRKQIEYRNMKTWGRQRRKSIADFTLFNDPLIFEESILPSRIFLWIEKSNNCIAFQRFETAICIQFLSWIEYLFVLQNISE